MTHRTDDEVMGVARTWRGGRPASPTTTCTPRSSTAWTCSPCATPSRARRSSAAPARARCSSRPAPTATTATRSPTRATSTAPARRRRPGGPSTRSSSLKRPAARRPASLDEAGVAAVEAARRASATPAPPCAPSQATDPDPADVLTFLYTDTVARRRAGGVRPRRSSYEAAPGGQAQPTARISYKDALREALVEEMTRDARVIFYGEDVADYGGAFKLTKGLLEAFGRDRVFNTPDHARPRICGTAVGRGHGRPAAGGRADVHGLRADGVRPDRQPGRASGTT